MNTIPNEIFKTTIENAIFGKTKNTFKDYRVFVIPVVMRITRRGNQTIDTMRLRKRGIRRTVTTAATTIVVARNRTITTGANKCRGIVAMASQTTNTGITAVAVVTTVFRYFYTPPFLNF